MVELLKKICRLKNSLLTQKTYIKISVFSLVVVVFTAPFYFAQIARADLLESDSYAIQFGNFNITSGEKSSASYNVTDTVGQTSAGPYNSTNFFVGAGFQYIYQIGNFSFSISDLSIPLGTLTPGVHASDTNTLTISTKGAGGFSVYAYETNPLRLTQGGADIDNTTCDAGTCTFSSAGVWTNQAIPGFGFNATGTTAATDFTNSTYFRPFADAEQSQAMQTVMTSPNIANDETVTVTYKAGIPGDQPAGEYQTSIIYVAVPGF